MSQESGVVVYQVNQMAEFQFWPTEVAELEVYLGVLKTRFPGGRVELTLNADQEAQPVIVDALGHRWVLWNPPNSGNYVLYREGEL